MIWLTILMALREVRRNALRSTLTMLGIVIGVGAVITMVTIGKGATAKVQQDVSALGENLLMVRPGVDRPGPGGVRGGAKSFEQADVDAVRREVPGIEAVSGAAQRSAILVYGNANWTTSVTGCASEYFKVKALAIAEGRGFLPQEQGQPVCVIGETVKTELFGSSNPLGERMRVAHMSCLVVGILAKKGQSAMGQDQDDTVLMPLVAFQRRLVGNKEIPDIDIQAKEGQSITVVQSTVEALLSERRRIPPGADADFHVRNVQEIADTMGTITTTLTALLGGIAAVSLLVGGIGIMNIMLVSVTERTCEIGTRLAIGALASEVMLQFLVEAVVLSLLGGLIGIGLGLGLSCLAASAVGVPFVIAPEVVLGAFTFSAMVGILFGYLPARKAAQLNPIEALRHE